MHMEEVLIKAFQACEIFYQKEKIEINEYENLIMESIVNVLSSENKKNLFVGIEEKLQLIILVVLIAIKNYYEEMKDPENNILDILNPGDKVYYKGKIYKYECITKLKRGKYIQLVDAELSTFVPIEGQHLISIYNGQATRINKVKGKKITENLTKRFISCVTNTEISKLNGVVNSSSIIIYRGKEELVETINSISIKLDDEKYMLSEIFPLAYYTSEDNFEFFKGNRIKENPVIKFVSNASSALDIVKDSEGIKDIVWIGENTYKDSLETELRMMSIIPNVKKLLVLDTWESNMDFSLLIDNEESYKVYALTKGVILDNVNLYKDKLREVKSQLQLLNYKMMYNMIDKNISISTIEGADALNRYIYEIVSKVKELSEYSITNEKVLEFVKGAYSLCNKIEESVMPLREGEANRQIIEEKIERLEVILKIFSIDRIEHKLMSSILDEILKGINCIKNENLKFNNTRKYFIKFNQATLIVKNKFEVQELEQYIQGLTGNRISVKVSLKNIMDIGHRNFIVTHNYFSKDINLLNTNLVENIQYVLYGRETYRLKNLMRKNNSMLNSIYKNNILITESDINQDEYYLNQDIITEDNKDISVLNNDISIKKLIDDNKLSILLSLGKSENQKSATYNKIKVRSLISFDDNNYAFISENYTANVLDRKTNDIKSKTWNEIQINDEIIFVKNKLTDKEDIIKVILKELLKTTKFRDMYGEYFRLNSLWKEALMLYMDKNRFNEKDISRIFKLYGRQVTPLSISNWLSGNIIGPQDSENIEIVASIVENKFITEHIQDIISACKNERSIQVSVRKAVAKIIIESVTNEEESNDDIYTLIKKSVDDLNRYAYIGIVNDIRSVEEEIGATYVNCIIESED